MKNQNPTVKVIPINRIEIPATARKHTEEALQNLSVSINDAGLIQPIVVTVKRDDWGEEKYLLVAGAGRLAAVKILKRTEIAAQIVEGRKSKRRRIEIAENIFRTGLTVLEESQQLAEYIERKAQAAQLTPIAGERTKEGGIRKAARDLKMARDRVARAAKIASIPDEVVERIKIAGLDDNQSALLKIAKCKPDQRAALIETIAGVERKSKSAPAVAAGKQNREKPRKSVPYVPKSLEELWNRSGSLKTAWKEASRRERLRFVRDVLSLPVTISAKAVRRSGRR